MTAINGSTGIYLVMIGSKNIPFKESQLKKPAAKSKKKDTAMKRNKMPAERESKL